jgi:hypothetical protein
VRDRLTASTEVVSLNSDGELGDTESAAPEISADGRYIAFLSKAANLVPDDTNGDWDAFVRDRLAGTTERVSVNTDGEEQNDGPGGIGIDMSADGRYVVFPSQATNLVPDDTNGYSDIFVRDRVAGTTERVSVTTGGVEANGGSGWPAISADGHHVAFQSQATNLAPEAGDTSRERVYVHDAGTRFSDVPRSFWAYAEIEACANAGIVHGYPDGSYHPAEPVNRAQMAVYISRALAGGDENVPQAGSYPEPSFGDVPTGYWAYRYIEYAADAEVVRGCDDGLYHREDAVDRGQMAVYVARAKSWVSIDDDMTMAPELFPDVPADHWAYKYIEYAVEQNVVKGYPEGDYRPDEIVNRGQMAAYVARALVAPAGDDGVPAGPQQPTFPDVTRDNEWDWCYDHVEYIAGQEVAQGYGDGLYHPDSVVSRDQMAAYIARAFDLTT